MERTINVSSMWAFKNNLKSMQRQSICSGQCTSSPARLVIDFTSKSQGKQWECRSSLHAEEHAEKSLNRVRYLAT